MKRGFVLLLILALGACQDKEVVQSGQPTHFHMEDRGPEIQVTADAALKALKLMLSLLDSM